MNFLKNKENILPIAILGIFCFLIFFAFIGSYPLIDVDETRYVRIAQEMLENNNWLTPTINGNIFLEKPPLYFWIEILFFKLFGHTNELIARIPMGIVAAAGVFGTYFFGKKVVSQRFGLISALALGSNVMYIVLSHIAILDLLLSVTMMLSAYCGIMTLYTKDKGNLTYWCGFYLLCGLSVLSKGIPGFVIPFGIVFFAYLFSKRFLELFDIKKLSIGLFILLLIIFPWHIMMYKVHGQAFINEYIIKHHLSRFINSAGINRKEPFLFYVPVILVGFLPFIFAIINVLCTNIKDNISNLKNGFKLNIFQYFSQDLPIKNIFLHINVMAFWLIFLFFSISSTKLPTYILPAMFPLAFITGYIFDESIENGRYNTHIKISNIILSSIFSIAAITALVLLFINKIEVIKDMHQILFIGFILLSGYSIYNFKNINKSVKHFFTSSVIFMTVLTLFLNLFIFNFIVNFGECDLIKYAKYAKTTNSKLATFSFGERYSAVYYYGKHIDINDKAEYEWLKGKLNDNYLVILKNKNMVAMPTDIKFQVLQTGKKYSLVKKAQNKEEEKDNN